MMNMNLIYFIVAIVTLISSIIYIVEDQPTKGWRKRFFYVMKIIFFMANLFGLLFINENPYNPKQENVKITFMMYILYIIPMLVYTIQFFRYIREQKKVDTSLLWAFYSIIFGLLLCVPKQINSEKIFQEKAVIINYMENEVRSTFIDDSIEGIDYVIVIEDSDGNVERHIIRTRTYKKDNDVIKLHLHQNNSHIEEYVTVETYIYFSGFTSKEVREEKIYEIYLTDDMYVQK